MNNNPYEPIKAKVDDIITESSTIKTLRLIPEEDFSFKAGEFIELTVPGVGEAPFTPSSSPYNTDSIDVTVMEVGRVTKKIHNMKKGDITGIRGPLGKGYPVDQFRGKEVLLLGGGVGMAPVRSLLLELIHDTSRFEKIYLCYGAKTPSDIIYKDQFKDWKKTKGLKVLRTVDEPEENWEECVGVATVLLEKIDINVDNSVAIVCGPPIMMKFGTFSLLDIGFKPENIYLSMERNMSCGFGKCGHCALGKYYVCKDGPVFTYDQIKDIPEIWV